LEQTGDGVDLRVAGLLLSAFAELRSCSSAGVHQPVPARISKTHPTVFLTPPRRQPSPVWGIKESF